MHKSKILAGMVFGIATILALVEPSAARRQIPDDNLAYPVLVTVKSNGATVSSGSGIYLNTDSATYFVTAKHVLAMTLPDSKTGKVQFPDAIVELLSYSKDLPDAKRNVFSLNFTVLRQSGAIKPHMTRDVVAIKVGAIAALDNGTKRVDFAPGISQVESGCTGILGASMETVRKFDQILVGNEAILYGYPASLGLPNTRQFDPLRPLLRKALIAGQDIEQRTLIIDGPVYRGNSGGPVFEMDFDFPIVHYWLVGILTQYVPLTESAPDFTMLLNSGYSIAEPMDFVLELVN
ncbi:MAG: hypothetical protein ACLQDM_16230 [Bradyrhizobium sp.]